MIEVIVISLIFGISQKLADAINEHGTVLFKGANILFGLVFGISGSILILMNNTFAEFYLGLVLYWLVAGKLDFFNHQLSGALMILVASYNFNLYDIKVFNVIFVISIFFLFKLLKRIFSTYSLKVNYLIGTKMHHFIIAIILGLWFANLLVTISIIFTMFGIIATIHVLKQKNNYNNCSS